jgi:hypothetical protein
MNIKIRLTSKRHAELVSASIVQQGSGVAEKWPLKRVQGDGVSE